MADFQTLARPYAQAAFRQAQTESFGSWSEALARLAAVIQSPQVRALVGHPLVARADLVDMLVSMAASDAPSIRNFVALLAEYRRLPLLAEIAEQFEGLRAAAENRLDATVVAAMPVDSTQSAALQSALESRLQRKVTLRFETDPELIGGVVVKSGDMVIDGSVRGALGQLSRQLS